MTHEQIEKAAEELRDSLWDGYANISPDAEWGEVTQAVFKSFLTRFSQQCEADALQRAQGEPKWISVKERLPGESVRVLICDTWRVDSSARSVFTGSFTKGGEWYNEIFECESDSVTHWMSLPPAPKGDL